MQVSRTEFFLFYHGLYRCNVHTFKFLRIVFLTFIGFINRLRNTPFYKRKFEIHKSLTRTNGSSYMAFLKVLKPEYNQIQWKRLDSFSTKATIAAKPNI